MGVRLLFIIILVFRTVLAFHFPEDCVVKPERKDSLEWPSVRIGAWLLADKNEVIEIRTEIVGKDADLYHDKIIVSKDRYEYIQTRHLQPRKTSANLTAEFSEGWAEFVLTVDEKYSLWYDTSNTSSLLLNISIEEEMKPESVIVKGSNITLNCPSELRIWHMNKAPTFIPLEETTENWLSFYSKGRTRPSVKLGPAEVQIRWDGQSVTTQSHMETLPGYILHNISIQCTKKREIRCMFRDVDSNVLSDLNLENMPKFAEVSGDKDDTFYVLLHRNDPSLSLNRANIAPITETEAGNTSVAILGVLLLLAILALASLGYYTFLSMSKLKKAAEKNIELGEKCTEQTRLLASSDATDFLEIKENKIERDELLSAVVENKILEVEKLITGIEYKSEEARKNACVEAHLLCRKKAIEILDKNSSLDRETTIQLVQKEYTRRVEEVFEAAQKGHYRRGVALLLDKYELPATVRDSRGRSLLHIITSAKNDAEGPLWDAEHIEDFLKKYLCYANAIDFEGQTCLHYLVNAASNSKTLTTWGKNHIPAEEAWLALAKRLVDYGCDPRMKGAGDQLPHEMAKVRRNLELSDYLQKSYTDFDTENNEKSDFSSLIKEAEKGNAADVMKLMKFHQQLLSLNASTNPLTAAVTRGHLETTVLLLSGGASICGHALLSITPLEASHGVKSLPAIFPAIIRRECINILRFKVQETEDDKAKEKFCGHIDGLISRIEKGTFMSGITGETLQDDDVNSKEAREFLCMAARLGQTLTCQMIGLGNFNLQPYPHEEKPILNAFLKGHYGTLYALNRDLKMSVFSHIDKSKLPEVFLRELWDTEMEQLKDICSKRGKSSDYKGWLDKIQSAYNGSKIAMVEHDLLAHVAQKGLIYILHVIKENVENFDVNCVIDELTGCTMLHIAAMYGRLSMVEYLLYDKTIDVLARAKGGFTAAHLAAVRGNKDCMNYTLFYMKSDLGDAEVTSDGGKTALQLLHGYEAQVKHFRNLFISDDIGMEVGSQPYARDKVRIVMAHKFSAHRVSDQVSLRNFINEFCVKGMSDRNDMLDNIKKEMTRLLEETFEHDKRFKGKITAYRSVSDSLNIPADFVEIFWETGNTDCRDDLDNFKESFSNAVRNALKSFTFKSSMIWLTYPSIKTSEIGVTLFLAAYDDTSQRLGLVKVFLIPLVKTKLQGNNKQKFLHPVIKECSEMNSLAYLANLASGKWTFIAIKLEEEIIKRLKDEQRLVLCGCKLLTKILYSCWWFPRLENRRHNKTWHSYAISLSTLPPRVITSLFLEEVNSTEDEEWVPEKFLDRMISIFRRAIEVDDSGRRTMKKNLQMFLDNRQSTFNVSYLVGTIVDQLDYLRGEESKL